MPRDNDKNNGRPPRRDRGASAGGKGRGGGAREDRPARSSAPRGDRKFGDKKPYSARDAGAKPYVRKSEGFRKDGDRPSRPRFDREDRGGDYRDMDDKRNTWRSRDKDRDYGDRSRERGERDRGKSEELVVFEECYFYNNSQEYYISLLCINFIGNGTSW